MFNVFLMRQFWHDDADKHLPRARAAKTTLRPRQRSRAKLNAETEQLSTVPTTTNASMISVFAKYRADGTAFHAPVKFPGSTAAASTAAAG